MVKKVHPLRLRLLSASRPSSVPVGQSTTSQQSPVSQPSTAANVPASQSAASPSVPKSKKSAKSRGSSADVPEQSLE